MTTREGSAWSRSSRIRRGVSGGSRCMSKFIPRLVASVRRLRQPSHRVTCELECQNRFRSAILVGALRGHTVAAAPAGQVAERDTAVVGAEKPAIGDGGVIEPAALAGDRV